MRPQIRVYALMLVASLAMAVTPSWGASRGPEGGCAGLQTEQEPNDTPAGASPITLSDPFFSAIHGAIAVPGDQDWFSFTAPAGSRLWLSVDTGVAGGGARDSVVSIFGSDGVTLIEADDDDGTGNGWNFSIESLDASLVAGRLLTVGGTHYARVQAKDPAATIASYSLVIAALDVAAQNEVEPTPPCASLPMSVPILGSLSSGADEDCYFIDILNPPGIPFIVVDGDPERDGIGTDITLRFEQLPDAIETNSSGAGEASNPAAEGFAIVASSPSTIRITGAGPGTYMLGVWWSGFCPVPVQLQGFGIE